MYRVYLSPGVKFRYADSNYIIMKRLPNKIIEVQSLTFGETLNFTENEIYKLLSNGQLIFEQPAIINPLKPISPSKKIFHVEDLSTSKFKNKIIFRFEVIKPILSLPKHKKHEAILNRVIEVNSWFDSPFLLKENLNGCTYYQKVSQTTLYRWIQDYYNSGSDIQSLSPRTPACGGKGKHRLDPKITQIIEDSVFELYECNQQITIKDVWYEILLRANKLNLSGHEPHLSPSYNTVRRYIATIPETELIASRIGRRSASNRYGAVGNGVSVSYPLERVEIDHTPVDLILVDEAGESLGRPYLVLAIDKFSRHVLGFSIGVSKGVGWAEVQLCIQSIMRDKSYLKEIYPFIENSWEAHGVPSTLVIDNGLEFKNNSMRDAAYQLGFVLQYCPPKTPQWKGSIERFFKSLNTSFFHTLPGTTRSNPSKLGDDENPSKGPRITFSCLLAAIHLWIVDWYSQKFNTGAKGVPSKLWDIATSQRPVPIPSNMSETAILLGRVQHRKITRRGIELLSLTYNSSELYSFFCSFSNENHGKGKEYTIKYDPLNIESIYVYDDLVTDKWIKAECTDPEYAHNLTEWEHMEIRSRARLEYGTTDHIALAKVKEKIRNMIADCIGFTPKQAARSKKINSENEINQQLQNSAQYKFNKTKDSSTTSFSDTACLGITVEENSIVIPEILSPLVAFSLENTTGRGAKRNKKPDNLSKIANSEPSLPTNLADFKKI